MDSLTCRRPAISAARGVSPAVLAGRLDQVLPEGVQAVSGAELTRQNLSDLNSGFLSALRIFLVIFAGIALPAAGLVVTARSVLISLAAGLLVTAAVSVIPAVRTSRVAPLEALRGSAAEPAAPSRLRAVAGIVAVVAGLAAIAAGLRGSGNGVLSAVGLGARPPQGPVARARGNHRGVGAGSARGGRSVPGAALQGAIRGRGGRGSTFGALLAGWA